MNPYVVGGIAGVVGLAIGFFIDRLIKGGAYKTRDELLKQAERDADNLRRDKEIELKEEMLKRREQLEQKLDEARDGLRDRKREIDKREVQVKELNSDFRKKEQMLQSTQQKLAERAKAMDARQKELNRILKEEQEQLYKISELDRDAAKDLLLNRLETELSDKVGALIMKHETEVKDECDRQAREIIGMAVQRYASAHTSEIAVSTVDIPSDEMKGRIIGREGRNIRAFERATGVDIIIDDTPGHITISSFDPIRRHTARVALEKLLADGRIQPAKIEEAVAKAKQEIEDTIKQRGEDAAYQAGVHNLSPELTKILGRLYFRTSYGQNILQHSIEMAHIAGMLAEEVGADVTVARAGALLHDIGKAVDHAVQGTHVEIGRRILQKFNVDEAVVKAMQSHHEEYHYETPESILVQVADAISAGRPGARRDTVENYLKRLEDLERIAKEFPGVEKCYAIEAGREVRVFVNPGKVKDVEMHKLARDIATKVQHDIRYPGEIKVNIIRENRVVEFAR